jgi:uncharacterized RDD family membrane protein YckC
LSTAVGGLGSSGRRVALQTPENVPLVFELASVGSRILAIGIDLMVVSTLVFLVVMLVGLITPSGGAEELFVEVGDGALATMAILKLAVFFIWNFYFIVTELRWQGRTLGKRIVGLRVIARDGGPLSAGLVYARNLTRDIEMLIPLAAIVSPEVLGIDSTLVRIIAWLWLGIMAFMPLFNQNRARVGDLLAGTLVVNAPRQQLDGDLVADQPIVTVGDGDTPIQFTDAQLDLYGIHELQILEDVLRRYPAQIDHGLLDTIAVKIQRKIGWEGDNPVDTGEAYPFLRAFYAAQRKRLEHKMLFGKRQERKIR